ncbi:MAG TPA: hypothetical protein VHT96_05600 [Clostridia bacterium]|nr:hypothetical protein [Clostridia bacterium]
MTIILLLSFSACGGTKKDSETYGDNTQGAVTIKETETSVGTLPENSGTGQGTQEQSTAVPAVEQGESGNIPEGTKTELLQSASVDLDADGVDEQVEAVMSSTPVDGQESQYILEGSLIIKEGGSEKKIQFNKREQGLTNILTSMQFEDLDNDGAKDVFIIIPDHGASFSYSTYFVYSYRKDKSFSFTIDNSIVDYIAGFQASYNKGGNKLTFTNKNYGFEADISIENGDQMPDEGTMQEYADKAWIDPTAIDISDESRLALVKSPEGRMEIKVPLPIFGMATVDMIGEIESFYTLDDNLEPVLRHFDMWDFKNADPTQRAKIGSCAVK